MQKRVSWKESHDGGGGGEGRESEHPAGTELRRIKKKTDDTRLAVHNRQNKQNHADGPESEEMLFD